MSEIGIRVNRAAYELFLGERGLPAVVGALAIAADSPIELFEAAQIRLGNVAQELTEKAGHARYPSVHLYCERVTNEQREKFRRFSGTVKMVAEVRVSETRMEAIERRSQALADAITEVLDGMRGSWGGGMFYSGGYEIVYGPVKAGGKNFVQSSKISFEVNASTD